MSNVTQFSMEDLKKRIAEQTQSQFGALIPKEMFEGLIEESVKAFFEEPQRYGVKTIEHPDDVRLDHWRRRKVDVLTHEMTPFRQMVWMRLQELVHVMIEDWMQANVVALREHVVETLHGPDLSKPFNQSVSSMAAVITTQQTYSVMDTALKTLGANIRQAMECNHIPHEFAFVTHVPAPNFEPKKG